MNRLSIIIVISSMMAISSCGQAMDQYKLSDVEILSVVQEKDGAIKVTYRPMLESVHYSPGANIGLSDGRQKLQFIRCGIKEKCAVALPAKNIGEGTLVLTVPGGLHSIDAVFSDGEKKLLP